MMHRTAEDRFDWLAAVDSWTPRCEGVETLEIRRSVLLQASGLAEDTWAFLFLSWASARLIRTGEWFALSGQVPADEPDPILQVFRERPVHEPVIWRPRFPEPGMTPSSAPPADFDWLLRWRDWSTRPDQRLESVFTLDVFLQQSRADRSAWLTDFLSWKYARLVADGSWYEARLEHHPDRTDVHVLLDR